MMMENKTATAVLVMAMTMVLMTGFQMRQVMNERKAIDQAFASQETSLKQVKDVSAQFESIAVGTAKLAGEGNKTASDLMAQMRKLGINVNPNATAGQKSIEFTQPETAQQQPAAATAPVTPAAAK